MEQTYTIAVIGGTGKAGQYLVKEIIKQGYKIRLLLRNPAKFPEENPLIEKVKGDARNVESISELINGCTAVISTLGQPKGEPPVFEVAAQNITKAMISQGIDRYIAITGLTIDTPTDKKSRSTKFQTKLMKLLFPAIIRDKQKEYEIISGSPLDWTMVRLPFIELTDTISEIKINREDCPGKKISSASLAAFLTHQITSNQFSNEAIFIANIS
jgi:putative NADH-flavin reductase